MSNYNGWTNYETWLVALWLDNDQTYYIETYNLCNEDHDCSNSELGDKIQEYIESLIEREDISEGFITDLLNSALQEVNWQEIAASLREELEEIVA